MNELETQLSKVLEKAIEIAEKSGEFVVDQAPELLQEFYLWHTWQSVGSIILSLLAFFAFKRMHYLWSHKTLPTGVKEKKFVLKKGRYYYSSWSDGTSESFSIAIATQIASHFILIWTFISVYKLAYISIAPKLYLIDYFI